MSASHQVKLEISDFFSALRILINELDEEIVELFSQKKGPTTFFYSILSYSANIDYAVATVEKVLWSEGGGDTTNHSAASQYGARDARNLIWDHHMQRLGSPKEWKALQARYHSHGTRGISEPQWELLGNDPDGIPDCRRLRGVMQRIKDLIATIEPYLKGWRDPMYSGTVNNIWHHVDAMQRLTAKYVLYRPQQVETCSRIT